MDRSAFSVVLPLPEAPRVYIDTAYLCDIADGKIEATALERLHQALQRSEAVVIFGPAHSNRPADDDYPRA